MIRTVYPHLLSWKNAHRSPLLVRGARQVGKSYIIEQFGKKEFEKIIILNFDLRSDIKTVFKNPDPDRIITELQLLERVMITPDTLIFLDEIQECPDAIRSLRYFKEKRPDLYVIGAGSLLEFEFQKETSMPVGRIQFFNIRPLNFYEFLFAMGEEALVLYLGSVTTDIKIPLAIHKHLIELFRTYLILGGMPEVVTSYINNKNLLAASYLQDSLIETYKRDFGKYGRTSEISHLRTVFEAIPRMVGQQIKFVNIDRESRSREIKIALELLTLAKVITRVFCTDASGLPLGATLSNRLKYIFLDVGLMQHICGIEVDILNHNDIMQVNKGSIAEQFIGQELQALNDPFLASDLYFWARDKPGSSSEIDYCIILKGKIYPVEVKSGTTGSLRSMRLFLEDKETPFGIRFWEGELSFNDCILSLPLYMTGELDRLIELLIISGKGCPG